MGTQQSPHMGAITHPTMMSLGTEWEDIGFTATVLPGDIGALLVNFSQTRHSCSGTKVTACCNLTVPILSES